MSSNEYFYRWDLERPEEAVTREAQELLASAPAGDPPAELDPRAWFDLHNQGSVGSCQGQSLADAVEFAHLMQTGEEVQISRAFAYLRSQEHDGLLGRDAGSTLSGGTTAAREGIPPERAFPYVASYRSILSTYRSARDSLPKTYRCKQAARINSYDEVLEFLQRGLGCVHIGIRWSLPNQWEITRYPGARGGGHAVNLVGYLRVDSWPSPGILLKNSWGSGWGRNGYALLHPTAVDQMAKAQWNVFVGRFEAESTPAPNVEIDL